MQSKAPPTPRAPGFAAKLRRTLRRTGWAPWLAAAVLIGLNAAKPLVIDDAAYHAYAEQIREHPTDPYGFEVFWGNAPQPARDVLAPPVVPYWWAGALALFGESVVAAKLSLLPFALALALSAWSLGRRFARGAEAPLVWLVTLSPAVAPSFNMMLDVPALALSLAALAVFAHAAQREQAAVALLAGVLAGVAIETKYTAATGFAALAVYGLYFHRLRYVLIAAAGTAAVFLGWEALMSARYGESHFLHHVFDKGDATAAAQASVWLVGGLALLGSVAAGPALLSVYARGRFGLASLLGGATVAVFVGLLLVPAEREARFTLVPALSDAPPELWLLGTLGLAFSACIGPVWWSAWRDDDPKARFLAAWVLLEVAGFFVLSPFLALRRLIGPVTALAFLCMAALVGKQPEHHTRLAARVAALGVALGLVFALADLSDARSRRAAFDAAWTELEARRAAGSEGQVWYVGHWGFQYLAERAGMRPLVAGESRGRRGRLARHAQRGSGAASRRPGMGAQYAGQRGGQQRLAVVDLAQRVWRRSCDSAAARAADAHRVAAHRIRCRRRRSGRSLMLSAGARRRRR